MDECHFIKRGWVRDIAEHKWGCVAAACAKLFSFVYLFTLGSLF